METLLDGKEVGYDKITPLNNWIWADNCIGQTEKLSDRIGTTTHKNTY